jgi:nucleoside-diphosphate-sugar epimerase
MKALITGGNGFIGSFLIEKLLQKGYEIRCLIRKSSNLKWLTDLPVKYCYGDITQPESLYAALEGVDYVFHLGGLTKALKPEDYFSVNTQGTANLLAACPKVNSNLKKFIFVSSLAASGPSLNGKPLTELLPAMPITPYGKSKAEAEELVLSYKEKFPVTILRPPPVYGPRDVDVFEIFKYVNKRVKPQLLGPERLTSMIYVHDLVAGIILAVEKEQANGQIFFLADGGYYSWEQINNFIEKALDKKAFQITVPIFMLNVVAQLSESIAKISGKPPLLNHYKILEMKQQFWICSVGKAKKELGFSPQFTLERGITETVRWCKNAGWL